MWHLRLYDRTWGAAEKGSKGESTDDLNEVVVDSAKLSNGADDAAAEMLNEAMQLLELDEIKVFWVRVK